MWEPAPDNTSLHADARNNLFLWESKVFLPTRVYQNHFFQQKSLGNYKKTSIIVLQSRTLESRNTDKNWFTLFLPLPTHLEQEEEEKKGKRLLL